MRDNFCANRWRSQKLDPRNTEVRPSFFNRPRHWRALRRIAIATALAFLALFSLRRAINPSWINHLVIIRGDVVYEPPLLATLRSDGARAEVVWTQELQISGLGGSQAGRSKLIVANIEGAWLDGHLTISDHRGIVWTHVEVQPPGRYCGTLVISVVGQGTARTTWNSLPDEDM